MTLARFHWRFHHCSKVAVQVQSPPALGSPHATSWSLTQLPDWCFSLSKNFDKLEPSSRMENMKQPTTSQLFSIDPWYPWFKLSLCHRPCPYGPRSPVVHRPKSPQKHRRWPAHLRHSSVKARGWDPIAGVGTYEGFASRGDTPFFHFSTETNGDLGIPHFKKPPSYSYMCVCPCFWVMENQNRSEIVHF